MRNRGEPFMHSPYILGGGVQLVLGHARVVNTVLCATRDSNLHLKDAFHGCHPFQVLLTDANVLVVWLLGQVEHVRGKQWLPMSFEECLIS